MAEQGCWFLLALICAEGRRYSVVQCCYDFIRRIVKLFDVSMHAYDVSEIGDCDAFWRVIGFRITHDLVHKFNDSVLVIGVVA